MGLESVLSDLDFLSKRNKQNSNNSRRSGKKKLGRFIGSAGGMDSNEYEIALIDKGFEYKMPFVLSNGITDTVRRIYKPPLSQEENAKEIFEWCVQNIRYGNSKRGRKGYRNSLEVFRDREGVCGEMAALYIVMSRTVGIKGSYVHVRRDNKNKRVHHACAMIDLPGRYGPVTLVDPAYRTYDIKHESYEPATDFEIYQNYKDWT